MKEGKLINGLYWLTVLLFLLFNLLPFVWAFILSVTPEREMLQETSQIFPSQVYWGNYQEILNPQSNAFRNVSQGMVNSLSMAFLTVCIGLPVALMTAYSFSRFRFWGRKILLKGLLLTIVIPVMTTIIPIYAMFAHYGWLDNHFWISLIYISSFLPISTWMIYSYLKAMPKELWEAARTDGCSENQAFFKVILPNAYPIVLAAVLMLFLMSWSQYQIPMILTSSQENKVVTLVMSEFMTRDTIHYGMVATAGILAIIPPAFFALVFRRFLISGLTSGSVKS
ncbi:carbohydrate ABC transporter permease [Atopobacter sp. AH10]|uniref:carbohydrate ABC transporter permease n=1 Tax=Atopobacter sp. AH10 TaxID=2315861 RepID=UPI000EF26893|nr:carbohydrate ABC transporter permease [Atopobacter sp. AH10]RLK63329.1 carbohydrate ABC transporter permease [Atopobacter sp. AH10]